ncbi:PPE domain-containing protein [Williamsia deligens]|uniref:PPE domain-containing protein n=1 Tax=Williamsia deligens TaxID=321325 RepID=A0ABW3G762_9NOCA|nr:PPE domain-containing protein [Williamsia deligens]MCP2192969.1 PPE family protein [Williamsia deligens]
MVGFTGVRWEVRPAEELSRQLSAGAGERPMFEAALAWGSVAASLHELREEFAAVRKIVDDGWTGSTRSGVLAAIDKLSAWVTAVGDDARANAKAAERQAIAHTVAVAAMPDAHVIAAVGQMETALKAVTAQPSALIAGGIAKLDEQAMGMKAQASRVMETYEEATTPVARPWEPARVPAGLVHAPAAAANRDAAQAGLAEQDSAAVAAAQGAMVAIAAMSGTTPVARASNEYVTQTSRAAGQGVVSEEVSVVDQGATTVAGGPAVAPVAPMASASHSGVPTAPVAGTNYDSVQEAVADGHVDAAPPVLGVSDREGA